MHGTFQIAQAKHALHLLGPLLQNLKILLLLSHVVQLLLFQRLLVQLEEVFYLDLLNIKLLASHHLYPQLVQTVLLALDLTLGGDVEPEGLRLPDNEICDVKH